ncbi:MAG: hypothetical protein GEV05_30540 [Betaproteobacteria bacterium]|nr:hypothetical protein [Betaproteobacteria bacterium]
MRPLFGLFRMVHALIALLFGCFALMLIASAARAGWLAMGGTWDGAAAQTIIEAVGLLAAAAVSLQMAETITEEEIIRDRR